MIGQLLDSLREPAHTGSRRCWPCTALNGVLVGIAALLVGRRWRSLAGVVVLGVGGLLIALRGYVVPYTPTVAPRIVDRLPVDIGFGHSESIVVENGSNPELCTILFVSFCNIKFYF